MPWLVAAVLAVSIGAVYGGALKVPFIFDDIAAITKNRSIASLWPLIGTDTQRGPLNPPPETPVAGRPLVNLSFAVNYHFHGLSPTAFHATNVAIHFLSSMLLWCIVARTLRLPYFEDRFNSFADWLALVVALIWALHPIQTEAVIYATQRTELMFAFFYLATLYCALRYWTAIPLHVMEGQGEGSVPSTPNAKERNTKRARAKSSPSSTHSQQNALTRRTRRIWLTLAITNCAAGMASKEVMVSAPLMVLLYERTFIAGSLKSVLRRSWQLYVGLFSTWILLVALNHAAPRSRSTGFNLDVAGYSWWLTQSKVLLMYLKLLVWPFPLLIHYELDYYKSLSEAWPYVVPVFLLGIGTLYLLWRNTPVGYLGTWVFAILSPTLVIPIVTEMAAERRMYLPLAAIVVLVVVGLYELSQKFMARSSESIAPKSWSRVSMAVPALAIILLLGWLSADRLKAYYDEPNLWQDVLRYYPKDFMVQSYRGNWLAKSGKPEEAIEAYRASLNHTPDDVEVLNNLAVVLMRTGRIPEGIAYAKRALELQPTSVDSRMTLGLLYKRAGQMPDAVRELSAALALSPKDVEILNNLGYAQLNAGRAGEAIETMQRATSLHPDNTEAHFQLATAYAAGGDRQHAIDEFRHVVELKPDYVEAYHNLGVLLAADGSAGEAISFLQQAIRLQPNLAEAHFALAQSLATIGRSQEAIATAHKSIEVARSNDQPAVAAQVAQWLDQFQVISRNKSKEASTPASPDRRPSEAPSK